jgi:hypothetical protein
MQANQKKAIARRMDDITNVQPQSKPPMVTRVEVGREGKADDAVLVASWGILRHPPRYAR